MFSDIMVPVATPASALPALEAALALIRAYPAHLTVIRLLALPSPVGGLWSMGTDPWAGGMYDHLRREGAEDAARIEARLTQAGVSHDVPLVECRALPVEEAAILHALHADVVIVGGGIGADAGYGLIVALMLKSGRPVIFVPAGMPPPFPPQRIVLAWKPVREAARAVHDAMGLLKNADQVDVVMVDMPDADADDSSDSGPLLAHLHRHGVHAERVHLNSEGTSVGATLQRHAGRVGAQLIVSGGYGHSRLREWALGGTTRELLVLPGVPVMFSH